MTQKKLPLIASMISSVRLAPIPETQATFVSNLLSPASISAAELDVGKSQIDREMRAESEQNGDDTPLYAALSTIGQTLTQKATEIGYTLAKDTDDQLDMIDTLPNAPARMAAHAANGAGHQTQQGDGSSRRQTVA